MERKVNTESHDYWSRDSRLESATETYAGVRKSETSMAGGLARTNSGVGAVIKVKSL